MAKIGILVPTKQIKERLIKDKDKYFDGKKYYGFNYIISEIDKSHKIYYISSMESELNSVDFVLYSITSYYDILNLINELRGKKYKCKIIVGGAGLLNFSLLSKYIDIAVLGRGEGLINKIIDGEEFENVWNKEKDKNIENIYKIGRPNFLINYKEYSEKNVGCPYKCYFCQYGWKNYLYKNISEYISGYDGITEDTIKKVEWDKYKPPYLISAIDGMSEKTRHIINKNINNNDILNKYLEFYKIGKVNIGIKLYMIIGFPWETKLNYEFFDLLNSIDKKYMFILNTFLISTHFCPMPMTPMENESINFISFRDLILFGNNKLKGKTFSVYWNGTQCSSPITAAEECILMRSDINDLPIIEKIFLSNKYKSFKGYEKIKVIKSFFPEYLWGYNDSERIIPYVEYPKGFDAAKKKYYENKKKYLC